MTISARFLILSLLAGLSSSSALAKGKASPAMEKAAKKACITGDVSKGIDILADLYLETNDITFVFNQGRCYQQNHRWEEAVDRFEEYLRKSPDLPSADRAEVDGYIADCRSHLPAAAQTGSPGREAAGPPPLPSPMRPDGAIPTVAGTTVATEPLPSPRPGSGLRTAAVVAGAVGLAALATGAILDLETHAIVSDVTKNGYDAGKLSSRDTYETWGWVSFGAGAAGIVAATTLYLLGTSAGRAPAASGSVAVVPVADSRGAMLFVRGGVR